MIPKFTIIIPSYNASKYIRESLESAIAQTYPNKEIIVVDNESTDDSLTQIRDIQEKHPHIQVSSAKNLYKYSWQEPVEKGLSMMTGQFFTILAADDILDTSYVTNCVDFMEANNCEAMQSPLYMFRDKEGNVIKVDSILSHKYHGLEDFKRTLTNYCCVTTPSVVYKSSVIKDYEFSMKSEEYLGSSDYYLYCSLADQGMYVTSCEEFLGYFYRTHKDQNTNGMLQSNGFQIDESIRAKFRGKWE
tara:strand:- start:230 stop:967 length:738 start_codon:yes stop_codon:yes gene_type:complete